MKIFKYIAYVASLAALTTACSEDEKGPGNPVLDIKTTFETSYFGDSIPFTIGVSDTDGIPLSTVKVKLYFDEEMVSEKTIRTKNEGDYSGKIYVPFLANIPNGTARLDVVLQNVNMTITKRSIDLQLNRPDYPFIYLVTNGQELKMERQSLNHYEVTQNFDANVPAYIKAPAYGDNGNEITFGWESDQVKEHSTSNIPFSNFPGSYAISFNTLTYEAAPFIVAYTINGTIMSRIDDEHFKVETNFNKGETINIEGIDNFSSWWIDEDYFTKEGSDLKFAAIDGKYRITADFAKQYLRIEAMAGSAEATLQPDGTGAIWIIGDGAGKPTLADSPGWNPANAICMAPIGGKKYQATFVAGTSINKTNINFKFFHQKNWGGEYKNDALSTNDDTILVGDGNNGRDPGNLGIVEGKSLVEGVSYKFVIDVSAGIDNAILTVTKK